MAKNELVAKKTAKATKWRSIADIMRDPNMRAKLTNLVDEAVKCKQKIQFEQQNIKVLREEAADALGLKPALFNAHVVMTFNNDYVQRKENLDEQTTLLELVMMDAGISFDDSDQDD